jgi:hypothetical protein
VKTGKSQMTWVGILQICVHIQLKNVPHGIYKANLKKASCNDVLEHLYRYKQKFMCGSQCSPPFYFCTYLKHTFVHLKYRIHLTCFERPPTKTMRTRYISNQHKMQRSHIQKRVTPKTLGRKNPRKP